MQYIPHYAHPEIDHYAEENITVSLHNEELWNQFYNITNEMILTKVGRRMFPIIAVNVQGLDPDKMYTFELSFEQIDTHRWRYVSGQWQAGLKPDPPVNRPPYQHPDSPNYGRTWMKEPILFSKVKLTNKVDRNDAGHVLLNSLHKYRPRISIIDVMTKRKIFETDFIQTEFIAVTAYQSEEVKALKIKHNPFAKAFLETGSVKEEALEQAIGQFPMFYTQQSCDGGPDRIKRQSYRPSPYSSSNSPRRRKVSPAEVSKSEQNDRSDSSWSSSGSTLPYSIASSSTPSSDLSSYYNAATPSVHSMIADNNNYYANYYYPPPDPYYYSYGAPTASGSTYPFMTSFSYPSNDTNSNFATTSFMHFQPSFLTSSQTFDYSNTSPPMKTEFEQL